MAKKKAFWWTIAIITIVVIILSLVFFISLLTNASWWWFFGTLIILVVVGTISAFAYLVYKLKNREPVKVRLDPKTAEDKAVNEIKYDEHNPDNFMIEKRRIVRVGEPGHERTTILHLQGKGTELGTRIDVVINLDNPKLEMSRIDGATDNIVERTIRQMAEHPEIEVLDKVTSFDPFGRPTMTQEIRRISQAQKEYEQKEKEADMKNIL